VSPLPVSQFKDVRRRTESTFLLAHGSMPNYNSSLLIDLCRPIENEPKKKKYRQKHIAILWRYGSPSGTQMDSLFRRGDEGYDKKDDSPISRYPVHTCGHPPMRN
jgi:hypothetical protein